MFNFLETPFSDSEALFVLCLESNDSNSLQLIERSVVCPFREDAKFNFPNVFDLLTYALKKLRFDDCLSEYEMKNVVFGYMDDLASSLDGIINYSRGGDGDIVPDISTVMLLDPSNPFLMAEAAEGERIMLSKDKLWSANARTSIFISITATVFFRSVEILRSAAFVVETSCLPAYTCIDPSESAQVKLLI